MKRDLYIVACLSIICLTTACQSKQPTPQENLLSSIDSVLSGKRATVGVAVIDPQGELITVNDTAFYPLMSVFKFHIALSVLDKMNRQNTSLDSLLFVQSHQLKPNTYSPLRKIKADQDFYISIGELLEYSVSHSDNNACDILIEYAGGTSAVNQYIQRLGVEGTFITATEEEMHRKRENQRLNRTLPSSTARLMKKFVEEPLFADSYKEFLIQTMTETRTGKDKLKGLLPREVIVAHKTGSSDRTEQGVKIADNDAGFVYLPNREIYYIAVFVKDSAEEDATHAAIIAGISQKVYEYMSK